MTASVMKFLDGDGNEKYMKGSGAGTSSDPFVPAHAVGGVVMNEDNYICEALLNGSSRDMNVDGSSSAVTFSAKPAAGYKWIITQLELFLSDTDALTEGKFGNEDELTNGVSVLCNNTEIGLIKTNVCVQMYFGAPGGGADIYKRADKAIYAVADFKSADAGSNQGLEVLETHGFAMKVQDDISGLVTLHCGVKGKQFAV